MCIFGLTTVFFHKLFLYAIFNEQNHINFYIDILSNQYYGQTKNQSIKVDSLKNWERKYFTQPLNNPFISYVIYGNFTAEFTISSEKYRTAGLPKGFDLMKYRPGKNLEVVKSFL